jgi:uncharacterized protein YggE
MAQTAKNLEGKSCHTSINASAMLMPSPKALERALVQSATRAQRLADAFGLKVPVAQAVRSVRSKSQPTA